MHAKPKINKIPPPKFCLTKKCVMQYHLFCFIIEGTLNINYFFSYLLKLVDKTSGQTYIPKSMKSYIRNQREGVCRLLEIKKKLNQYIYTRGAYQRVEALLYFIYFKIQQTMTIKIRVIHIYLPAKTKIIIMLYQKNRGKCPL